MVDQIMDNEDVEFVPDEENSGGSSLSGESKLAKQKDKLESLKAEKEEYLLNWQKERADFVNYKRDEESRLKRARDLGFERGSMGTIKMLDTFDMAMANKDAWNNVDANWRMGVEYIYNQGVQFLEDAGIVVINPGHGSPVDPMLCDAVETAPADDIALDGTISNVIQKGYRNGDSIIRPARVSVYKI
jgi:molecular chaperone GrpE